MWLFLAIPDCEWQPNALFFLNSVNGSRGSGLAFSTTITSSLYTLMVAGTGTPLLVISVMTKNYLNK